MLFDKVDIRGNDMGKMQMQFHATTSELFDIVIEMTTKNYYMIGFVCISNDKT